MISPFITLGFIFKCFHFELYTCGPDRNRTDRIRSLQVSPASLGTCKPIERKKGIESSSVTWQATVIPLYDFRVWRSLHLHHRTRQPRPEHSQYRIYSPGWSRRPSTIRQPPPWQGGALPIELLLHREGHVIYPFKGLPQTLFVEVMVDDTICFLDCKSSDHSCCSPNPHIL